MASISVKKRLEVLEAKAARVDEIGLEGFVRLSYLPKPLPDDMARLMEATKLAPLLKEAFGSWARNGGGNTPPPASPAPAASYRSNPAPVVPVKELPKSEFIDAPTPRQQELCREPPLIPAQPGLSLDQLMMDARASDSQPPKPTPSEKTPQQVAWEEWLQKETRFNDDPNRPRRPGL